MFVETKTISTGTLILENVYCHCFLSLLLLVFIVVDIFPIVKKWLRTFLCFYPPKKHIRLIQLCVFIENSCNPFTPQSLMQHVLYVWYDVKECKLEENK